MRKHKLCLYTDSSVHMSVDSRLLPFDGIGDRESIMKRLKKTGYNGAVISDVSKKSRRGHRENDTYRVLSERLFITEAYKRACRLAELWEKV